MKSMKIRPRTQRITALCSYTLSFVFSFVFFLSVLWIKWLLDFVLLATSPSWKLGLLWAAAEYRKHPACNFSKLEAWVTLGCCRVPQASCLRFPPSWKLGLLCPGRVPQASCLQPLQAGSLGYFGLLQSTASILLATSPSEQLTSAS